MSATPQFTVGAECREILNPTLLLRVLEVDREAILVCDKYGNSRSVDKSELKLLPHFTVGAECREILNPTLLLRVLEVVVDSEAILVGDKYGNSRSVDKSELKLLAKFKQPCVTGKMLKNLEKRKQMAMIQADVICSQDKPFTKDGRRKNLLQVKKVLHDGTKAVVCSVLAPYSTVWTIRCADLIHHWDNIADMQTHPLLLK